MSSEKKTLYCSFCEKSQFDVRKLIAGKKSFICDECLVSCQNVIDEGDEEKRVRDRLSKEGYVIIHESKLHPDVLEKEFPAKTSLDQFNRFFK